MNEMVRAVFLVADACSPDHLVVLPAVTSGEIAVGEDRFLGKAFTDVIRIDKLHEAFTVVLIHGVVRIPGEPVVERELYAFFRLIAIFGVAPVADTFVLIQVDIVDTSVIRGHRRDHAVLNGPSLLFFEQLGLERELLFHLFLLDAVLGIRSLFLDRELRILTYLEDDEDKHAYENESSQQ